MVGGGAYVSPSKVSLFVCAFSHTGKWNVAKTAPSTGPTSVM